MNAEPRQQLSIPSGNPFMSHFLQSVTTVTSLHFERLIHRINTLFFVMIIYGQVICGSVSVRVFSFVSQTAPEEVKAELLLIENYRAMDGFHLLIKSPQSNLEQTEGILLYFLQLLVDVRTASCATVFLHVELIVAVSILHTDGVSP